MKDCLRASVDFPFDRPSPFIRSVFGGQNTVLRQRHLQNCVVEKAADTQVWDRDLKFNRLLFVCALFLNDRIAAYTRPATVEESCPTSIC